MSRGLAMAAGDSIERGGQWPKGTDRICLVICASAVESEKRNPAKAGNKFVHFGGILQTAGDRGGSGSRLASPCLLDAPWTPKVQWRNINSNLPVCTANVTDCPSTKVRCDSSAVHPRTIEGCRLHC